VNSPTNPNSFTATGTIATTNSADLFGDQGNGATGTGTYYLNGATGTGTFTYSTTTTTTTPGALPAGVNVAHGAIDSTGDMWITSEGGGFTIARITPTGTTVFPRITLTQQPEFPAIDNSGNAWIATQDTASKIYEITPSGGQTVLTSASTGAELTSTFGAAVDGNGNVWFANRCGNFGTCGSTAGENSIFVLNGGGATPGTANKAISPPTNYVPEAQYPAKATTLTPILNDSLNLAIDPSGNLWITNYLGNSVVEIVGAAAPVVTPLSVAAGTSTLGAKP
jgi:streptogramin lyase